MRETPSDRYTHGHHASVVGAHARRTAEREAGYLLPRLSPGMRLLDAGCGPGTITTGLARAIAPGEVLAVDLVPEILESARRHAETEGVTNVRFQTASIYDLPCEDGSFGVVHAHQVLQHLTRPEDAAAEAFRVLRPGGLFAVRDADYATMTAWPRLPELDRWLELYHAVASRNGADADSGRRLPSWLRHAGFVDLAVSADAFVYAEREGVQSWGMSWADRVLHSSFGEQAVEYALATRAELEWIAAGWRRWADDPDAFFVYTNVEVVGVRP